MQKVYLDKIDIDDSAKLTLCFSNNSIDTYLVYFISYGVIAEQVLMQGSAPMKSRIVQKVFENLKDAFMRDENHDNSNPIYSFALAEDAEGYFDYLKGRISKLNTSSNNAETEAYRNNEGLDIAAKLDRKLKYIGISKRTESVGKIFKKNVLVDIRGIEFSSERGEQFKEKAISVANEMEIFQSFDYMKALRLNTTQHYKFYNLIRKNYLASNAMANGAKCTFNSIHFKWQNIRKFLSLISVMRFLVKNINHASIFLFHLRLTESLAEIKVLYFQCQSDEEIQTLFLRIEKIKKHGKYKALLKESPSALVSFFFTSLNENNIGYKSINKAGEMLTKATISDTMDTHLSKELFVLISSLEKLEVDLAVINKKLNIV